MKNKGKIKMTSLRMPEDLWKECTIWCVENKTKVNALINELLKKHMEKENKKAGK